MNLSHGEGRDGALRRPRRVPAAQRGTCWTRGAQGRFRPLVRGRGHRSAMSLPGSGSWAEGSSMADAVKVLFAPDEQIALRSGDRSLAFLVKRIAAENLKFRS